MKRLTSSILLILVMGCISNNQETLDTIASNEMNAQKDEGIENDDMYKRFTTELYELRFEINKLENGVYDLILDMELKNGSYYVSPNSKGNFTGIFSIIIDENDKFEKTAKLIETPLSVEEYDSHPFVRGYINWVKENTNYRQRIKRKSDEDFEVSGIIQFTIEPKCTLEKIPFFIKYKDGKLKVEIARC